MSDEIPAHELQLQPAAPALPAADSAVVPAVRAAGTTARRRRWLVLAVIGVAQLMVVLDATIVNIAGGVSPLAAAVHGDVVAFTFLIALFASGALITALLFPRRAQTPSGTPRPFLRCPTGRRDLR